MSTKSTFRNKTPGVEVPRKRTSRPRAKSATGTKAADKRDKATELATRPAANCKPAELATTEASPAEAEANPDEPQDRPNRLTNEQKDLDLLTQIELALGIKETALFGTQGLVAARNFQISRPDCRQLLNWLEHRCEDSITASRSAAAGAPEVKIGSLRTRLDQPATQSPEGAVALYGSDMYTQLFYRRGHLWFMAAFNYELDIPYVDFSKWQRDLLAMLSEFGL